ncbi:MAG TPA: cbb3-type cytochrome c oxidase subunit I [Vicinamibacterales bacterium]
MSDPRIPSSGPHPLPDAPPEAVRRAQAERLRETWQTPRGWRYFSDVNNSTVGLWYTTAAFGFFLFGGMLALLMRIQLAVPDNDFLPADLYNQVFTLHGSVMMFLFAVPIFEAVSIMILPQMLGGRDLPFPRLSAFGFWSYIIGGVFVCGSIFFDVAPRGGWFMYPPLTTTFDGGVGVDIWLLGLSFIEIASIAAAVELIVGILKCRPPGMRINLIPLYCWYILVVGVMILFAFPPLIAGDLLLELERTLRWPFFDARRGGDPLLWQHLFWIFGHPEVYIVFLPSVALIAMILPTFARRPMVGYSWIVLAAVGTGFLSFALWVHHMFTTGLPGVTLGVFSAASQAVAIPTAVQIFCFIATLLGARLVKSVPVLFAFGALVIFVMGGLTGVMVALVAFNFQAHDTYFVVAHLHSVLIGGALFPILAGFYYYYPLVTAKALSERLGRIAFWLLLAGFLITFMPMHLTGLRGMVRRVYTYPEGLAFEPLNLTSTIGAFILAAGILVIVFDVIRSRRNGVPSRRDPWRAGTLEWLAEMPGEPWGVRSVPLISSRYPLWDQKDLTQHVDEGRFYLPDAEEGKRETLVTTVVDAQPVQCLRVPGPSFVPVAAAIFTGGVFILSTFHLWWAALASGVLALMAILVWLWTGTSIIPEKAEKDVGLGVRLPIYISGTQSIGWWAMFITMLGDFTAFASLVFGYFFYWTSRPEFLAIVDGPGFTWPAIALGLAVGAWGLTVAADRLNRADCGLSFQAALLAAALFAAAAVAALVYAPVVTDLDPRQHVYPATVWALVIWAAAHVSLGIIMLLYCVARRAAGRLTAAHDIDIANVRLYWHFAAATMLITVAVLSGTPLLAS